MCKDGDGVHRQRCELMITSMYGRDRSGRAPQDAANLSVLIFNYQLHLEISPKENDEGSLSFCYLPPILCSASFFHTVLSLLACPLFPTYTYRTICTWVSVFPSPLSLARLECLLYALSYFLLSLISSSSIPALFYFVMLAYFMITCHGE